MNKKCSRVAFVLAGFFIISAVLSLFLQPNLSVSAETEDTNFTVNIAESLAVTLVVPDDNGTLDNTGDAGDFLRNAIQLSVFSNASGSGSAGFTASMYEDNSTTSLYHTKNNYLKTLNGGNDVYIPTLDISSTTRYNFPYNYWGYSLESTRTSDSKTYNESSAGNDSSYYYPMTSSSSSPITIFSSNTAGSDTRYIFFGAKADNARPAGTYSGTIVISVVTGTINSSNPATPTNPATDNSTEANNPSYAYNATDDRTVYTSRSTNSTTGEQTTTTIVSSGDTTSSYQPPAGETESTFANINSGSGAGYGIAAAAGAAATSGILFLVFAKRDDDDDEEEEQTE